MIAMLAALAVQGVIACDPDVASLRAKDQALLDAIAPVNRGAWEQLITSDFVYVDENGAIMPRDAFLKTLVPLPPHVSGQLSIVDYRVHFNGDAALVIHRDDERENYHGIALRAGYLTTEAWLCQGGHWKLALVHAYTEAKDPPAITIPRSILHEYEGHYSAAPDLELTIRLAGDHLVMERKGRPPLLLLAETPDVLFVPGEPRIKRIFLRDSKGSVTAFIDRREGEDIVWRRL
jgi:hypothetical protein